MHDMPSADIPNIKHTFVPVWFILGSYLLDLQSQRFFELQHFKHLLMIDRPWKERENHSPFLMKKSAKIKNLKFKFYRNKREPVTMDIKNFSKFSGLGRSLSQIERKNSKSHKIENVKSKFYRKQKVAYDHRYKIYP